jgi:hypothetical protein
MLCVFFSLDASVEYLVYHPVGLSALSIYQSHYGRDGEVFNTEKTIFLSVPGTGEGR